MPVSELLRKDHPLSQHDLVNWIADPFHFHTYANLMRTLKTGESAMEVAAYKSVFDFFRDDPEEGQVFNAASRRHALESSLKRTIFRTSELSSMLVAGTVP